MAIGKLVKIDREYTVTICDNGYTLSANGRDSEDNWVNSRFVCTTEEELFDLAGKLNNTPLND